MGDTAWTDPATPPLTHVTVLLDEAVNAWLTEPDGVYVDGTYGRGGHSRLLLQRLGPRGRLLALDRDPEAIASATQGSARVTDPRFHISQASFADLPQVLDAQGIGQVQGVLLDVGVSSPQIDAPGRGFSFRLDGPLDMRMDPTRGDSAADFLARADERHIAEVIRQHGEERFAVSIAKALVARREGGQPVRTTRELSEVVAAAVKTREPGQNPATRTFQALRIHVNAELEALELGLDAALKRLAPMGRLVVISFHSLEDRIVKTFIARHSREVVDRRSPAYFGLAPAGAFEPPLRALGRVRPSPEEVARNPRARSAIMRVAEKRVAAGEAS